MGLGGEDGTGNRLLAQASRHRAAIAVAAITLSAAALRFATLGDQSLDHDETVTAVRVIHDNFFQTLGVVVRGERSPPLYYVLIWLWSRVFGTGAIALRSLSAVFGVVTVVFAYLAGRELLSRRAGLIAALLVALNPYLIWYSQEARSYGTLVMLGAIALYFFARARRQPTRSALVGWAIASSLALLTHYFAVFFIAPEALLLLLNRAGRRRAAIGAIAAVAAMGAALLPLAIVQEGTGRGNGFTQFPVAQRAETALVKYTTVEGAAPQAGILSTTPEQRQLGLFAAVVVGFAVALVATRGSPRERRSAAAAAGVALSAFGIPLLLAWAGFDFVDPRNLIGALVPALVALGIALSARRARSLGVVGAFGCAALFVVAFHAESTTPAMQRHDWRAAAAAIPQHPAAQLVVAPEDGRTPLKYYTGHKLDKFVPKHFAGGVATRRIVVVSDYLPVQSPDPRFRLISSHTAPQHWTINVYGSRRPEVVGASRLGAQPIMPQPATLLARGRPILLAAEQRADKQVATRVRSSSDREARTG